MYALGLLWMTIYYSLLFELFEAIAPDASIKALLASFGISIVQLFSGLFVAGHDMGAW